MYAARCGAKLNEVKARLPHGQFVDWLQGSCKVTVRQSQKYMKLAVDMPELLDSNTNRSSHLPSINQAMALLNAPDEVKEAVLGTQI